MILQAVIKDGDGATLGILVLQEKAFKSGSRGFHGQGKIELGGKRYQCQAQLVEIGSKDAGEAAAPKEG